MSRKITLLCFAFLLLIPTLIAHENSKEIRMDPPFWWTDMKCNKLQIMLHGDGISHYKVSLKEKGVNILAVNALTSKNYLFVDLEISSKARPGVINFLFTGDGDDAFTLGYELKAREPGSAQRQGFSSSDIVYLLMPDRFVNGDPANDDMDEMLEKAERANPDGRHGGDIKGVIDHIDYFKSMGFTALWLNPVLENNQPKYSYHGYAVTDHYKVDARLGSNQDYLELVKISHDHGIKVIMDLILNHVGNEHYFIKDMPSPDWVNQHETFTKSNFRIPAATDPNVSEYDKDRLLRGWFDGHMPDLNQGNPYLLNYLVQNTIWWIEYSGIDGIRMDTQPYLSQKAMAEWAGAVKIEYPNFSLVGEVWVYDPSVVSYYQGNANNSNGYNSGMTAVTDYPLYNAIHQAFSEEDGWASGMARLHGVISSDFVYPDPTQNMIFTDNHDVSRIFSALNEDLDKWKLAMAFLMTSRGMPMIYSGTEVLLTGHEHEGHGKTRKDFPGGWNGDKANVFNKTGLDARQIEAIDFLSSLSKMRNNSPAIQQGEFVHFIPENGVYPYFRILEDDRVMILINNSNKEASIESKRFHEFLKEGQGVTNLLSRDKFSVGESLKINANSFLILKLD